jgi:hypothetical protein
MWYIEKQNIPIKGRITKADINPVKNSNDEGKNAIH